MVVVYDPTGGFVTGGGWIESVEGAYKPQTNLLGRAKFGFVSKYQKCAQVPTGNTKFIFEVAKELDSSVDFKFESEVLDWLVVTKASTNAQFKGSGKVNEVSGYKFMIWATDDDASGDRFRIKIWQGDC
jgi:hypothetical protein